MKHLLAIAVDFGASNVRAALVAADGSIIQKKTEPTHTQAKTGGAITQQITTLITTLLENAERKLVRGIGIASIGPLDYENGGPVDSPNIPYAFVPLVKPLQQTFSLSVQLLNDTNAAALAEKQFGAGKAAENLVYITISTGIGGGAIVNNNLLLGKGGNAAEIGHMIVDTTYNIPCTCKKGVGHWEGMASGTNIPKFFAAWTQRNGKNDAPSLSNVEEVFRAAHERDVVALEFLDELARVNARAISSIIVAYDPELITLGGSVTLNNETFIIPGIQKYVDRYLALPDIRITPLGQDVGLLGAAAAVFQNEQG